MFVSLSFARRYFRSRKLKILLVFFSLIRTFAGIYENSVVACSNNGEEMRRQLNELQARNQADSVLNDTATAIALAAYFKGTIPSNNFRRIR